MRPPWERQTNDAFALNVFFLLLLLLLHAGLAISAGTAWRWFAAAGFLVVLAGTITMRVRQGRRSMKGLRTGWGDPVAVAFGLLTLGCLVGMMGMAP